MIHEVILGTVFALGQTGAAPDGQPTHAVADPAPLSAPDQPVFLPPGAVPGPRLAPIWMPAPQMPAFQMPVVQPPVLTRTSAATQQPTVVPTEEGGEPFQVKVPFSQPAATVAAEEPAAAAAAAADRWLLMRALQGTWPGAVLDGNRMQIYGWTDGSFTASTADHEQQAGRLERPRQRVPAPAALGPLRAHRRHQRHHRADLRLPLGLAVRLRLPLHAAARPLQRPARRDCPTATARQNLYGVDPIAVLRRRATSRPSSRAPTSGSAASSRRSASRAWRRSARRLMSRSYAFNWCPPFTHTGHPWPH